MPSNMQDTSISLSDALKSTHPVAPMPELLERRIARKVEKHDATFLPNRRRARFIKMGLGLGLLGTGAALIAPSAHIAWEFQQMASATKNAKTIHITRSFTNNRNLETWEYGDNLYYQGSDFDVLRIREGAYRRYPKWETSVFDKQSLWAEGTLTRMLERITQELCNPIIALSISVSEISSVYNGHNYRCFVLQSDKVRSIYWMNPQTKRLAYITAEIQQREGRWTPLKESNEICEYDMPLPSEIPQGDTLPSARMVDAEKERKEWLLTHAKPIVEKDGIQIFDVQTNKYGDVFIVFDAKEFVHDIIIRDNFKTLYATRENSVSVAGESLSFEPSIAILNRLGQPEGYTGIVKNGRGLQGGWFPAVTPVTPSAPRVLTLTIGGRALSVTVTKPTCELVPAHMPLLASFPNTPTEFIRKRATIRVGYLRRAKKWSEALAAIAEAREISPKTEYFLSKYNRWESEAREALGLAKNK
jgi:hypothetical protein